MPKNSNKRIREAIGKKIVDEINRRLQNGWSPYFEYQETFYAKFENCCSIFINQTAIEVKKEAKRPDTLRSYESFLSVFSTFLKVKKVKLDFIIEFNKNVLIQYLDYIYYERNASNRTYNNHLNFFITFFNWLVEKGYVKENFCISIRKKEKQQKKRTIITKEDSIKIINYLKGNNFNYLVLSMITYSCLIRRTELTKLKVEDVKLSKNIIVVPANVSKNKKEEIVTIPNDLIPMFAKHLQNANNSDFLFSNDNFRPGKEALKPKKISDYFSKMRDTLNLPNTVQFYSWKDTGITDLFEAGIPTIKIRNQARHYDIKMTENYTHRNLEADPELMNKKIIF